MAFADYLDLRTAVIEHVANPSIADVFPRLVLLAESSLNRKLRTRDQMARAVLTVVSGTAALPLGFMEAIGLFDARGCEYIQQPVHMIKDGHDTGYYAIEGGNLLVNSDGEKALDYYAALPTLTASQTATNWLLQKHPSLYLYAVGYEAAKYLRDVEGAVTSQQLLDMELADLRAGDFSARYSRARIVIPGVTP